MIALRFLRDWRMYNGGEVATFTPDVAEGLLRDGVAQLAQPAAPEVEEPSAEEAEVEEPSAEEAEVEEPSAEEAEVEEPLAEEAEAAPPRPRRRAG